MARMAPDPRVVLRLRGEVTERSELLDGSLQVTLDGEASDGARRWTCTASLTWTLGRSGEVELEEGDLALEPAEGEEAEDALFAVVAEGLAQPDPDTGAASVTVRFAVDDARGEWAGVEQCAAEFRVGVEDWTGQVRVGA